MRQKLFAIFAPALIALIAAPGVSFAQTHAPECDIEDSLSAFLAFKDQTGMRINLTEEFRLEKALLQKVIACMDSETDTMAGVLRDLKDLEPELAEIRDGFAATLGEYRERLGNESRRLREIPELKDVKLFSKELLKWREKEYRQKLQKMLALSYVVHGRESQKIAAERLSKINAALRTLGLSGNRELRVLLDKAAKHVSTAEALNREAYNLLLPKPEPEKTELGASTSTAAIGFATSTPGETAKLESEPKPEPNPKDIAKEALENLRDAYRLFVNISETVRRLFS